MRYILRSGTLRRATSYRGSSGCCWPVTQRAGTSSTFRTAANVAGFVECAICILWATSCTVHRRAIVCTFGVAPEEVEVYETVVGWVRREVGFKERRVLDCEGYGEGEERKHGIGSDLVHTIAV